MRGFSVEYLSKVPEVKDTVHKHSLLHHLCSIIIEQFPDSTDLYSDIGPITRCGRVSTMYCLERYGAVSILSIPKPAKGMGVYKTQPQV